MNKKINQHGIALVTAILFAMIILLFIITSASFVMYSQKAGVIELSKEGQAKNIARAGIQDAIGWFKRQDVQPVKQGSTYLYPDAAFDPKFNASSELRDTDNASVGIVKDIKIFDYNTAEQGNKGYAIYGRYIIKKQLDPNNNGIIVTDKAHPALNEYDPHAVHDITPSRGKGAAGSGIVWYIESTGYVYQRRDFATDTNGVFVKGPMEPPNRIIDKAAVSVEINRLTLSLPLNAALLTNAGGTCGSRCKIYGDSYASAGVAYNGTAPNTGSATIQVTPKTNSLPQAISEDSVFGVSKIELKSLADSVYTSVDQIAGDRIPLSIVYFQGNATFTTTKRLSGSGILFVDGNLTLSQNSNSIYSGLIYVTGTYTQNGGNMVGGAVISKGAATVNPSADIAIVEFNDALIKNVRSKLGLYRENNLTYQIAGGE